MSRILTITLAALMLASCAGANNEADTYNKSIMPKAAASLRQEVIGCKTRWAAKESKTYSGWFACQLTAERGFARTIALTRMDAFEVYAGDMQTLGAEWDAHRVTDRQARSRAKEIQAKFLADCGCRPARRLAPNWVGSGPNMGMPSGDVPYAPAHVDNPFEAPH